MHFQCQMLSFNVKKMEYKVAGDSFQDRNFINYTLNSRRTNRIAHANSASNNDGHIF